MVALMNGRKNCTWSFLEVGGALWKLIWLETYFRCDVVQANTRHVPTENEMNGA